eukprot:TRINITY_DN6863_c0_g1_i1.p1 TRINITY_DN6863_c0_g1~~TRINITY_DN6863_c0_g1_i1.p1  ORF type:complete len:367 (-),score=81.85 TRINITY_DN6863_c0_g1_i1:45-1145(-)
MLRLFLITCLFLLKITAIRELPPHIAAKALPQGNAAYVYDVSFGTSQVGATAMWASWIENYNNGALNNSSISIVYAYGGDMEYYPDDSKNPYQTYFDVPQQKAALDYLAVKGVENVVLVIDGREDGGQSWSPDFSKLTTTQIHQWADTTAALYCSYSFVGGIQVDLEPFKSPYRNGTLEFYRRLSSNLRSYDKNCVNPDRPYGRSVSAFMFASAATPDVFDALGPNGFVVVSGYDLGGNPAGVPNTPNQYSQLLQAEINTITKNAGTTGKFSIAIPGAASTHEFTEYVQESGKVTAGYPMYSSNSPSYVPVAISALSTVKNSPNYIGTSIWGFSSFMAYPPHSQNLFFPAIPFEQEGEEAFLQKNL